MNPKQIGERSEGMVLCRFLQLNWIVLMPFGDNQRYDFVIERGNGFEKVQVKTARLRNGAVEFCPFSSQQHRGKGVKGYKGQCDYFAAYCPDTEKVYFIKVDDCCDKGVKLRIDAAKNNQKINVRFAKDYIL